MGIAKKRGLPVATAAEQADRGLTPEQKLTIDTMASWARAGMEPDQPGRQTVEDINTYLRGEVSMEEYLRKLKGA